MVSNSSEVIDAERQITLQSSDLSSSLSPRLTTTSQSIRSAPLLSASPASEACRQNRRPRRRPPRQLIWQSIQSSLSFSSSDRVQSEKRSRIARRRIFGTASAETLGIAAVKAEFRSSLVL